MSNPYEVWTGRGWTWKVLKKYKGPEGEAKDPLARWFCLVISPLCPNGELGDVVAAEVIRQAAKR